MSSIILSIFFFIFQFDFLFSQGKFEKKEKKKQEYNQEIEDYLKLFHTVFDRLSSSYVDSINSSEIILSGIKGLMNPLDPYTKLLMGKSKERYDILRKGKYGGVGISIDEVRDTIIITSVYQDSPSYFEGLNPGDMIIKIDTTSAINIGISKAVKLLKGEIDAEIDILIYRKKKKEKKIFTLRRGNISVNNVPYWGMDENNIGYIKINKFSKNTSNLFIKGLDELSSLGMEGLIIDLRLNGGGLLNESIKILDALLPVDLENPILFRKGRTRNTRYFSKNEPHINLKTPIILLQDRRSASASEIVSGVLQDLDRAVIVGGKSFGKGLVQMTNTLNDSISLKITTAKYYLPSGRLIQKSDYLKNGVLTDGLDKKDSTFYTSNGRKVLGGSGILPEIKTQKKLMPPFVVSLWRNERLFISFAESIYNSFTNDAFLLYKKFLLNKYNDSFSNLDSNIYYVDIFKDGNNLSKKIDFNKNESIDLLKRYALIREVAKIYKQLDKYERYQNLEPKDYDHIVYHIYKFKDYFTTGNFDSKRPTTKELKLYINDIKNGLLDGKLIVREHDIYDIMLKLLGIMTSIEVRNLDETEKYVDEIDYLDIDANLKSLEDKMNLITKKIRLQREVLNWYIKILSGNIASPHYSVPINEYDYKFISKEINVIKIKNKMVSNFKKYVEKYEFDYKIEGEREFQKLKDILITYQDFSQDTSENNNFFESYIKRNKYKKTIKDLEKFIAKKKNQFFFKDENLDWIINGILREYSRLSINNAEAIRTSLYIDSEYYESIELLKDLDKYNNILDN